MPVPDRPRRRDGAGWESATSWDEAFRVLGANLRTPIAALERRSVMVASARPGEGRTTACAKLGLSLARHGLRVVVVDLDLRAPKLHTVLGAGNEMGASDVICGEVPLAACLHRITALSRPTQDAPDQHGLVLLTSGSPVDEPDELLSRPRTARMLDRLAADADVVLVDVAPLLPVADALTVGRAVGAALLLVDPRRTSAAPLQRARDLLARNGTDVLGLVVNQVRRADAAAIDGYGITAAAAERR